LNRSVADVVKRNRAVSLHLGTTSHSPAGVNRPDSSGVPTVSGQDIINIIGRTTGLIHPLAGALTFAVSRQVIVAVACGPTPAAATCATPTAGAGLLTHLLARDPVGHRVGHDA
jgi:hypothetical protein